MFDSSIVHNLLVLPASLSKVMAASMRGKGYNHIKFVLDIESCFDKGSYIPASHMMKLYANKFIVDVNSYLCCYTEFMQI